MKYSKGVPKIKIQVKVKKILDFAEEHNLQGTGSNDNPLIFSKSFSIPITLYDSDLFITFKQCTLDALKLNNCKNITFQDVELKGFHFNKCALIKLNECKMSSLVIRNSSQMEILNCNIKRLTLAKSYNNYIKECNVDFNIDNFYSRENTFDHVTLQNLDLKDSVKINELIKGKLPKTYLLSFAVIPALLYAAFWAFTTTELVYTIMIVVSIIIAFSLISTVLLVSYTKAKRFEPNKII